MTVLVIEDKLGITAGYMATWESMCIKAGLNPQTMTRYSLWKSPSASRMQLLIRKGNRKSPGFNPDQRVQHGVHNWFIDSLNGTKATHVLCMDLAMLGMFESDWNIATIDNLRGGVYHFSSPHLHRGSVPCLITAPISAVNTQKKLKDIRALNEGAESKEDWEEEEHDDEEFFFEPYSIKFGQWVLGADLRKLHRIMQRK